MTWQPLPPSIVEWMGMDDAPGSAPTALGIAPVDPTPTRPATTQPAPVAASPRRPLIDLSPLIDPLEAWLTRRRTTHPS